MVPLNVLIIEDNPADAKLIEIALGDNPYCTFRTQLAQTLAEGAVLLGKSAVDVILLDLDLPDASGVETIGRVHKAADLPVVVSTGSDEIETGRLALQNGAADFVPKGEHDLRFLPRVLSYAVDRHRLNIELAEKVALEGALEEISELSSISGSSPSKVAASSFAEAALAEAAPDKFMRIVGEYQAILRQAEQEKRFRRERRSSVTLKALSLQLAGWRCGPRDAVDVHLAAVRAMGSAPNAPKRKSLAEESRFLLIELLGYLVLQYRSQAVP